MTRSVDALEQWHMASVVLLQAALQKRLSFSMANIESFAVEARTCNVNLYLQTAKPVLKWRSAACLGTLMTRCDENCLKRRMFGLFSPFR